MRRAVRCLATLVGATAALVGPGLPAAAATPPGGTTVAVIGDTPYGADQTSPTALPNLIASINADPDVTMAVHLGDIKNGSTRCDDSYFSQIRSRFDTFADPLVYTPGDNEWTDCHRVNNGGYIPTDRLDLLRKDFFPTVGQTLGGARTVASQANDTGFSRYRENLRWVDSGVVFATFDIPGSNNDQVTWFTGTGQTRPTSGAGSATDQANEVSGRTDAVLAWIDSTFAQATSTDAPGVVLSLQADMWDPAAGISGLDGFDTIIDRIATRSISFGKPVLMLAGDSHVFTHDNPLDGSATSLQKQLHPTRTNYAVPNFRRVIVQGQQTSEWLKLTVDPRTTGVFSVQRVTVSATPTAAVPEAPYAVLPLGGVLAVGVLTVRRRRQRAIAA